MKKINPWSSILWIIKMIRYNLKVIFAGKFIWFLLASLAFFVLVTLATLFFRRCHDHRYDL